MPNFEYTHILDNSQLKHAVTCSILKYWHDNLYAVQDLYILHELLFIKRSNDQHQ